MSFLKYFGITKEKQAKRQGIPVFRQYKGRSKEDFKEKVKNLQDYNDKKKAQKLDKELRKTRHGKISNKEYLKLAGKKFGYNFKKKMQKNVLTDYVPETKLSDIRKKINIYYIQKERQKAGKAENKNKNKFANDVSRADVRSTASRVGASPGDTQQHPSGVNIDRPILKN